MQEDNLDFFLSVSLFFFGRNVKEHLAKEMLQQFLHVTYDNYK